MESQRATAAMTAGVPRSSKRRRWLLAAAVLAATLTLARWVLPAAGTWLVVEDPLQRARAVVVFGGTVPFRAIEAATLFKQGWTNEVWLTQGALSVEDVALLDFGIRRTEEHVYSRMVLEQLGVPSSAIRELPGHPRNTAEEVLAVASALQASGGDRVILVSSMYHTRRVKVLWRALVGHPAAIVRYAPGEPLEPARWWHDTKDALPVAREWFGLLNVWSGFPVKSGRR